MKPVNLGIVGCGVIGRKHAAGAAAAEGVELVAVADLDAEAVAAVASEHGVARVYPGGRELLADAEVEAVVLALPTCVRLKLVLEAFSLGKHVLTEKPVGMSAADVEEMIAARGELVAGCCSARMRLLESARAATEFLAGDELGEIRMLRCRGVQPARPRPEKLPPPWRLRRELNGGGILANWGCYDLDYMLGLTGWRLEPRTVLARTWAIPERFRSHVVELSDAETHAAAMILCAGGEVIQFERGEYTSLPKDNAWQVLGEQGSLTLNMVPWEGQGTLWVRADTERGAVEQKVCDVEDHGSEVPRRLIEDFAGAVREGREPLTSLENARVVQKITDAIYASAESGRAVDIA
jgi:predicted dehydrogenase